MVVCIAHYCQVLQYSSFNRCMSDGKHSATRWEVITVVSFEKLFICLQLDMGIFYFFFRELCKDSIERCDKGEICQSMFVLSLDLILTISNSVSLCRIKAEV